MSKIVVLGSTNIDIIAQVKKLPFPGETVGNARMRQANGGKGANQAVAAARLGGDVTFLTCLGNDANGRKLSEEFSTDGVNMNFAKFTSDAPTGTALIFVAENGENCIAVIPGANSELTPEDVEMRADEIRKADYLLLQQEIPEQTVIRAINIAFDAGVKVVLNPAPMRRIPEEIFSKLYLITPNETETSEIINKKVSSEKDAIKAAESLRRKGVSNVIITMGSSGSLVCDKDGSRLIPSRKVQVIDTTAAGDVYNGALLAALSENKSIDDAAKFATVCSSIAVTHLGAQPSIPYREEVDAIMLSYYPNILKTIKSI
jgi:ribokinase